MSEKMFNPRNAVLLLMIVVVALLRLASFKGIGPLTWFTPVGAMALFGGAYFKGNVKPFLFPLLTLFISDVIVSFMIFPELRSGLLYTGWYWTYLSFALMVVVAKLILKKVSVLNLVIAAISATLIHWIVSDIGMCVQENHFSLGLYFEKLVKAVPYEIRFLQGTVIYGAILFGIFELLQRKYPSLYLRTALK